jgi:predicted TIM-barrel fold metal-dependent hydrolase
MRPFEAFLHKQRPHPPVFSMDGLDGYLTALIIGPRFIDPRQWIGLFAGEQALMALYTPPNASTAQYAAVLDTLGIRHGVLLQPSIYGDDNSRLLDALEEGQRRLHGVVVSDPRLLSDTVVADWSALGVCGVRLSMLPPQIFSIGDLAGIGARLAEIDWHLSLVLDHGARLADLEDELAVARCHVVIEQMGRMKADAGPDAPGFRTLLRLLSGRKIWTKLSHPYHLSATGYPYGDTRWLAKACIQAAPDRVVWASDWPHAMVEHHMPDDGFLLDLLDDWVEGDEHLRREILVTNPSSLFVTSRR